MTVIDAVNKLKEFRHWSEVIFVVKDRSGAEKGRAEEVGFAYTGPSKANVIVTLWLDKYDSQSWSLSPMTIDARDREQRRLGAMEAYGEMRRQATEVGKSSGLAARLCKLFADECIEQASCLSEGEVVVEHSVEWYRGRLSAILEHEYAFSPDTVTRAVQAAAAAEAREAEESRSKGQESGGYANKLAELKNMHYTTSPAQYAQAAKMLWDAFPDLVAALEAERDAYKSQCDSLVTDLLTEAETHRQPGKMLPAPPEATR